MDLQWFKECSELPNFQDLKSWLSYDHDQLEYYKMCITLGQVAKAMVSTRVKFTQKVDLTSVMTKDGMVNVCNASGVSKTKKATPLEVEQNLKELALVANRVASRIDNSYMPKRVEGTIESFNKFSDIALQMFKSY